MKSCCHNYTHTKAASMDYFYSAIGIKANIATTTHEPVTVVNLINVVPTENFETMNIGDKGWNRMRTTRHNDTCTNLLFTCKLILHCN